MEDIVCSACPFLEKGTSSTSIPCGVWNGVLYKLAAPNRCAMVGARLWTEEELQANIFAKHGEEALSRFLRKRHELSQD